GICMAIGASYAGDLAFTTTSGPGLSLKSEALGLAIIAEIPLVVVNVQRGGPSTGLPTKTEQSDLFQALYGRHGESPLPVLAASTPANCFDYTVTAAKIAVEYMTPVILLTDGYLGNGSEPWKLPNLESLPIIKPREPASQQGEFLSYRRDPKTLAREWCEPGTPGMAHRIGGLEKEDITGNVSYVPQNHEFMVRARDEKILRVVNDIPEQPVIGDQSGDLLVVSWGGTYGAVLTAVSEMRTEGHRIGMAHFHHIYPLPKNTKNIFDQFKQIVVCELNLGQFHQHLSTNYPTKKLLKFNKVQGQPFMIAELKQCFAHLLSGGNS
ncbi:MAG TPA: 2-oxoacid:acceptor oxidoreductase subunit alpha, partial [bacterium]|nr:2-oxoacid:acceptor oxidoreductase subunit alpha [bacterium]